MRGNKLAYLDKIFVRDTLKSPFFKLLLVFTDYEGHDAPVMYLYLQPVSSKTQTLSQSQSNCDL